MGKENDLMLDYLRDNRRFADLLNGSLFAGKQVVRAEELEEAGEAYTEYDDKGGMQSAAKKVKTITRARDVKKRLKTGEGLRILAVEDQSLVSYIMPWRCMNYDCLEYGRQIKHIQANNQEKQVYADDGERTSRFTRSDGLTPVYTVCLYHGTEHWDGPRRLNEMMRFGNDEESRSWRPYFNDYGMNLICVNELDNLSVFKSGLRELFGIMAYRKDKKGMNRFLQEHDEYRRLDEDTAVVISGLMGVRKFMSDRKQYKEGSGYNMCQAIREMLEDSVNEGISLGISQGISQGIDLGKTQGVTLSAAVFRAIRSGLSDTREIAVYCDSTEEDVLSVRKAFEI